MRTYPIDLGAKQGITIQLPWTCSETKHRRSHEDVTQVNVPRQIRGDDCGVYVCMFANQIRQRRQIGEAEQSWVHEARIALRKQILEQRYHRTTPEVDTDRLLNDFSAFTDDIKTSLKKIADSQLPMRGRNKRTLGYYPDKELDENTNINKQGANEVPGK